MNKINGYTEEEAKDLIDYIWEGKQAGKTLTWLFAQYGARHGRAKGSVRNYYYALMKKRKGDERVVKLLDGKQLTVEEIREFTEEETDAALKSILAEKSKGLSVRRAISNISHGDDKLMLRLQNKYRNVLKKQPSKIAAIAAELGMETNGKDGGRYALNVNVPAEAKGKGEEDFFRKKLESEIDALCERIGKSLRDENARLSRENARLRGENESLKRDLRRVK